MKLNLGCGNRKIEGFINIDSSPRCHPDLLWDVLKGLPYKDGSCDMVRAFDFLEHIPLGKTIFVMDEIYRVLCPGGILEHFTPSTDGRGAFQDPTHLSFWNKNSWEYYTRDDYREMYGIKARFQIITLDDIGPDAVYKIVHTHGVLKKI